MSDNTKEKKLNILIATGIYPPDIGGPATILKALAESLVFNDFSVKVITYSDDVNNNEAGEVKLYKISRQTNAILRYAKYFWQLWRLSDWTDIIYVTDTYSVGYFAFLIKKIKNKKYIVRFAGDSAWETSVSRGWTNDYIVNFQDKIYNRRIERLKKKRKKILKNADRIIAVSNFMADLAFKIVKDKSRIRTIYNSVDFINEKSISNDLVEKIKDKYGHSSKVIVTSCRLTRWKGVDGIIRVLPELKKQIGKINFIVLGDGPELENLKALTSKLGVKDEVHFIGRVAEEETFIYFKAADLYILNSNYEGLSHALLNVMRCGAPIIATNVGGNPEVINNEYNGLLVSYNNQEEILNAMRKILQNKELGELYANHAREKLKKFSWEKNIDATVDLLKKVYYDQSFIS